MDSFTALHNLGFRWDLSTDSSQYLGETRRQKQVPSPSNNIYTREVGMMYSNGLVPRAYRLVRSQWPGKRGIVPVAAVTPNIARSIGLPLDKGVVISHRLWQGEFEASADARGEEIRINGITARISGIAPGWLEGIYRDRPVDIWTLLPEETLQRLDDARRNLWVMARLGPGISPSQAKIVVQKGDRASELLVVPYTGLTPERAVRLSRIGTLLEFAAGAVFFIACVNVAVSCLGVPPSVSMRPPFALRLGRAVASSPGSYSPIASSSRLLAEHWACC